MSYNRNWSIFFEPSPEGVGTYLSMLLIGLRWTLVTALFSSGGGFDALYGLRILSVALALYSQRKYLPLPTWPPSLQRARTCLP